jgi:GNAT superfamily N-acetyltransferase
MPPDGPGEVTERARHPTLRRAVSRLRDARYAVGIARLAWTAPRWLIRRQFLVTVKDLSDPLPSISLLPDVAWRRLAKVEVPRLLASSPTLSPAEIQRRLQEGQECWVGWMGEAAAHWRWETREEAYLPYLHRVIRPLEGDLWVADVYTHPPRRRRGLYTTATVMAMHRAREQGHRRLIGLIAAWNRPALRVAEVRLRREVVGTVGYLALGPWRPPIVSGSVRLDDQGRVFVPPRAGAARAHRPA